ncbi:D-beta-hydroxybutyrate dehydrogenase, mitochondrial-like [Brevipalpus obovatus]|uniref:D-beta-hydroxybutyrate dehydrogenase, mitochondrial-like n=1 Tax=Brevipalpus obovatus TaxID=246614 RepID=UPI003D9FA23E
MIDCDSKFGRELARSLNHLGFRIIAGVLKPGSKSSLKLINEACIPWKMHLIELDTAEDKILDDAFEIVEDILISSGDQLYGLVNGVGAFDEAPVGSSEKHCSQLMNHIFWRVVKVTKKFLPLIQRDGGRILTITSTASHQLRASKNAYEATMCAVRTFMDALRHELLLSDARVIEIMIALSDSQPNRRWKIFQDSYWKKSGPDENPRYYPYFVAEYDAPASVVLLAIRIFIRNETPSFIDATRRSVKKFLMKFAGPEIDILLNS